MTLGHELAPRGQHMAHGHLFDRQGEILGEAFDLIQKGLAGLQGMLRLLGQAQPIMSLIESHAHYVHSVLHQNTYPSARIEAHFNLATLLMRLFGGLKVAQYTDALPQVTEAAKAGRIDALFQVL